MNVRVFSPHLMILFVVLFLPRGPFCFLSSIYGCDGSFLLVVDLGCKLYIRDQYGTEGGRRRACYHWSSTTGEPDTFSTYISTKSPK